MAIFGSDYWCKIKTAEDIDSVSYFKAGNLLSTALRASPSVDEMTDDVAGELSFSILTGVTGTGSGTATGAGAATGDGGSAGDGSASGVSVGIGAEGSGFSISGSADCGVSSTTGASGCPSTLSMSSTWTDCTGAGDTGTAVSGFGFSLGFSDVFSGL